MTTPTTTIPTTTKAGAHHPLGAAMTIGGGSGLLITPTKTTMTVVPPPPPPPPPPPAAASPSATTGTGGGGGGMTETFVMVRPTEAQLRWAQFHHKRRAVQVRMKINVLYQYPETIDQVPGAFIEDGATTTSYSSSSDGVGSKRRQQQRPKVSRGRRALLRVSRRKYERRRLEYQEQQQQGNSSSLVNENQSFVSQEDRDHDEVLKDIFIVYPSRRRQQQQNRRRHNHHHRNNNTTQQQRKRRDEEAFKRFQEACHSVMMNLARPPKHSILVPSKKWKRATNVAPHILDDEYLDPKWGIRRQQHSSTTDSLEMTMTNTMGQAPLDRGASWMIHLPKAMSSARENPYYHDPSLVVIPPTTTTTTTTGGSYRQSGGEEEPDPTFEGEEEGTQKFSDLVAIVQQRMIQRQEKEFRIGKGGDGPLPPIKRWTRNDMDILQGGGEEEDDVIDNEKRNDEFLHRKDIPSSWSQTRPSRGRKNHYIPRMRLRDFLPEGSTKEEVEELERSVVDGKGIPPRMKLREFPMPPTVPERRKSRAQEIAESFEPKEERPSISKTRQMVQSIEGGPSHPMMRLRQSLGGDDDEKKTSESTLRCATPPPPSRRPHALSEPFNGRTSDESTSFSRDPCKGRLSSTSGGGVPTTATERMNDKSDQRLDGPTIPVVSPGTETSTNVQTPPPRRKLHPMSSKFVQASNLKVSVSSTRVTDFFSQIRQGGDSSSEVVNAPNTSLGEESNKWKTDPHNRQSSGSTSTRKERASDFFASIRQLNRPNEETTDKDSNDDDDVLLEDTDFFAQVREMITTDDDDAETASRRVSDFFAQMREMSQQAEAMEEEGGQEGESPHVVSEQYPLEHISRPAQSRGIAFPPSQSTPNRSSFVSTPGRDKSLNVAASDVDGQSVRSGISGMLNRGRVSLASTVSTLSEKTAQAMAKPGQRLDSVSPYLPSRLKGSFQPLETTEEPQQSTGKDDEDNGVLPAMEHTPTSENRPEQSENHLLPYDGSNDLEAMALYRKSQEHKRLSTSMDDAMSTHSSFNALPSRILEVVKSRASTPAKSTRHVSASPQYGGIKRDPPAHTSPPGRKSVGSLDSDLISSSLSPPSSSPMRASTATVPREGLTPPGDYRRAHDHVMRNSPLLGSMDQDIIDTDGTTSDASYSGMDPSVLTSMMMSPDLLQKRLRQAVRAVEDRRWDNVRYLLNANPWLAEMCELTTNQYLIHKIAFFGRTAPIDLCEDLIGMFPSAIYKFDQDGNVPLHLAAAAGHYKMIQLLGERFEGGASIRNEDGMLPLHFTIASYGDHEESESEKAAYDETNPSPLAVIKAVLKLFPKAVAIGDNDGNLPIHVAAECLVGNFGVEVVYMLLDEADRQLHDPYGARFYNKVKLEDIVKADMSADTSTDGTETDSMIDDDIHCSMVRNDFGETPLLAAIRCRRGWDMIEALVCGPGGHVAAMYEDSEKNNALHLLVGEYQDPAAAVSILKIAPKTASMRNFEGMLPIEVACLQLMPPEVILAIALVDLPFDIDDKHLLMTRDDGGSSWWFLACECDDHYVDVVQQIVMICTTQQVQLLCSMKGGSKNQQQSVLSRATPKCKQVLQYAQRFMGRFEIIGDGPLECDESDGVTVFEALDYMDSENDDSDGRRVILKCYANDEAFSQIVASSLAFLSLDPTFVEVIEIIRTSASPHQNCILIECPQATLDQVVDGMMKNPGYRNDTGLRKKYAAKICAVLRLIAKALCQLHSTGVVHGNVCMATCGKFEHSWKLLDTMGIVPMGMVVDPLRLRTSVPPEALHLDEGEGDHIVFDSDSPPVTFQSIQANPSIDIWAFGKLAYETLVGEPLVPFNPSLPAHEDALSLLEIVEWDQSCLKRVFTGLLVSGVTESCAELITSCLFPNPKDRPVSMEAILQDPFWSDMRQYRERSSPPKQSSAHAMEFTAESSRSLLTEDASSFNTSIELDRSEGFGLSS